MAVGGNVARGLARRSENVETQALGLVGEAATAARNDHKERPEELVAQLVEQRAYTASVVGSSPAGSTGGRCRRRLRRKAGRCVPDRADLMWSIILFFPLQ